MIMNKTYAFSEGKIKSNSISVIYVPKTNGCKDNIKWFDDNKLFKKNKWKFERKNNMEWRIRQDCYSRWSVEKGIRAAYKEIFGSVLQEYNKRQKRADRRIDDYYEHILKSKNGEKPFYEDVIQWGSMEDFRADPRLREKAKECLVEYARTFEARNPNLKLIGAYVHMDEASPHLHHDYIPVASGYKTGMQTRNSLDKAMKQMGYVPVKESRINNATKLWKEHERAYFGELCRSKGLKVEAERKARGSLSVDEYKEAKSNMLDGLNETKMALIREIADKNQKTIRGIWKTVG